MATDAPDWYGLRWKIETVQRPNLIYPSGKAIITDDFESPPLKWETGATTGGSVTLDTTYPFNGSACMKLLTGTASPYSAYAWRWLGNVPSTKIGIQFAFSFIQSGGNYFRVYLVYYDGTTFHQPQIRYDMANAKWQYSDSAGAITDVEGGDQNLSRGANVYHFFKVGFDLENKKYLDLQCNNKRYDLTDEGYYSTASSNPESLYIEIRYISLAAAQKDLYIDDIVITEE